jgi:hypothetical protein
VGDAILGVEEHEAREREWFELDTDEWNPDAPEQANGLARECDLEPAGVDEARKPGRPLTEQQRRAQVAWGDISRHPESHYADAADGCAVELWHGEDAEHEGEALGVRISQYFREDPDTEAVITKRNHWLSENDSQLTLDGITAELAAAFESFGLSLDDVRGGAFRNGKPSAAGRELRAKVRLALLPAYEGDRKRVSMAEVLGCSTAALWRLMTKA